MLDEGVAEAELKLSPTAAVVSKPGGELRFVTVLFADLAGFTSFAEDRAPDEVARIVGDLLQRLGQVVEDFSGAVDKFLGDAVVATFGLPKPDPNAARNAVRAGLAMQAAARRFNDFVETRLIDRQIIGIPGVDALLVDIHHGHFDFRIFFGDHRHCWSADITRADAENFNHNQLLSGFQRLAGYITVFRTARQPLLPESSVQRAAVGAFYPITP